jgi:hypothetical protein
MDMCWKQDAGNGAQAKGEFCFLLAEGKGLNERLVGTRAHCCVRFQQWQKMGGSTMNDCEEK